MGGRPSGSHNPRLRQASFPGRCGARVAGLRGHRSFLPKAWARRAEGTALREPGVLLAGVAQWVEASSGPKHQKLGVSILTWGVYGRQPMGVLLTLMSVCLSLSLKSMNLNLGEDFKKI